MEARLTNDELLFLNVDPQDFSDPAFTESEVKQPHRVVNKLALAFIEDASRKMPPDDA